MNKFLSLFLFCGLSCTLFAGDAWLKEMSGIGKIADKNRKRMHKQGKDKAGLLAKERTLRRQAERDDKSFRQGDLPSEHPLAVVYLQRVCKIV